METRSNNFVDGLEHDLATICGDVVMDNVDSTC